MKQALGFSVLLLLAAAVAFGHAGEVHSYMGTVTKLNADGSFVIKTAAGKVVPVAVSKDTKYLHSDNHAGKRRELVVGSRVVVKISKDGKTATSIKFAGSPAAAGPEGKKSVG